MNCLAKIREVLEDRRDFLSLVSGTCTYDPLEVEDFWQKTSDFTKKLIRVVWVVHCSSRSSLLVRRPASTLTRQQQIHYFKLFPFRIKHDCNEDCSFSITSWCVFWRFSKTFQFGVIFPSSSLHRRMRGGSDWWPDEGGVAVGRREVIKVMALVCF